MPFVVDVSAPFTRLLILFQNEELLILIFFKKMKNLLTTVLKQFCKSEKVSGLSGSDFGENKKKKRELPEQQQKEKEEKEE